MRTCHLLTLIGLLVIANPVHPLPAQARDGAQFNQQSASEPDAFLGGTMGICRLHRHISGHFSIDARGNLVNLTAYCHENRNRGLVRESQLPEDAIPQWNDRLRKISNPGFQKDHN